jgi:thioredoxin 1
MDIKDGDFEEKVLKNKKLTIVDFWAPWCMPCQMLKPITEELAEEKKEKADIYKMNVDECPETAEKYSIRGIPAVLFFKDGEVVKEVTGMQSKEVYEKEIEELS